MPTTTAPVHHQRSFDTSTPPEQHAASATVPPQPAVPAQATVPPQPSVEDGQDNAEDFVYLDYLMQTTKADSVIISLNRIVSTTAERM